MHWQVGHQNSNHWDEVDDKVAAATEQPSPKVYLRSFKQPSTTEKIHGDKRSSLSQNWYIDNAFQIPE